MYVENAYAELCIKSHTAAADSFLFSSQICWHNVNKIRESRRSPFESLLSEGKDYRMSASSRIKEKKKKMDRTAA